jgi:predicted metal-dependent enzyme (double-stranded beta helix superfamily)
MEEYASNAMLRGAKPLDFSSPMPSVAASPSGSSYSNAIGLVPLSSGVLASFANPSNYRSLPGHAYSGAAARYNEGPLLSGSALMPRTLLQTSPPLSDRGQPVERRRRRAPSPVRLHRPTGSTRVSGSLPQPVSRSLHKSQASSHICDLYDAYTNRRCKQPFDQLRHLQRHEVDAHRTHRCHVIVSETGKLCNARFHFRRSLKLHMTSAHECCQAINLRTGAACNKAFFTRQQLEAHMKEVHGGNDADHVVQG